MNPGRVHRLLRSITLLQERRHCTADELAREPEVSRRTIFQDLNALEMAHVPCYFDAERGGYRIAERFFLPPVNLTLSEALAMLLLARRAQGEAPLPLLSQSVQAAAKLESALPRSIRRHVGSLIDRLHIVSETRNLAAQGGPTLALCARLERMFEQTNVLDELVKAHLMVRHPHLGTAFTEWGLYALENSE